MISTMPPVVRASIVKDLAAVLQLHRDDPEAAGLASLQVLRRADGVSSEPGSWWTDLLDPAGIVRYSAELAAYGHTLPVGTRDVPGNVMPSDPDVSTCARIALERLHRVPPIFLAEMVVLANLPEPGPEHLGRAREIVASIWARFESEAQA